MLMGLVAACSRSTTSTPQAQNPSGNPAQLSEHPLPEVTQLAVGIFKLEETDLAVSAEQAGELLTLWQAYQSMSSSETTAPAELDALINQIKETLTTEQQQAIAQMQPTYQDMMNLFQSLGLEMGMPSQPGMQRTPGARSTQQAGGAPAMGGPGGPFPGGEGMFMPPEGLQAEATLSPSLQATLQARMELRQKYSINPMLLKALIELLEGKVQGSP
jgi:hypothetical protein